MLISILYLKLQSFKRYCGTRLLFDLIFLQRKRIGTGLLTPKAECTICLTSWRSTYDLGS